MMNETLVQAGIRELPHSRDRLRISKAPRRAQRFRTPLGFLILAGLLMLGRTSHAYWTSSAYSANVYSPCPTETCQVAGAPYTNWGTSSNPVTISQVATGQYVVSFPGLAAYILGAGFAAGSGHVQVTAVGTAGERCKLLSFGSPDQNVMQLNINCFSATGTPTNSRFTANWTHAIGSYPGPEEAYFEANPPSGPTTYDLGSFGPFQWNSTGDEIHVSRTSVGLYQITLDGQNGGTDWGTTTDGCVANSGIVEVTALGADNTYCKVRSYTPAINNQNPNVTSIQVACFNGSTGAMADSAYMLTYSTMFPTGLDTAAIAFANEPSTSSYNPSVSQVLVNTSDGNTWPSCDTAAPTITRSGVGVYTVTFWGGRHLVGALYDPISGPPVNQSQYVKVTGYGAPSGSYCEIGDTWVGSIVSPTDNVSISVRCFGYSGTPVDEEFMIDFSSTWDDSHI